MKNFILYSAFLTLVLTLSSSFGNVCTSCSAQSSFFADEVSVRKLDKATFKKKLKELNEAVNKQPKSSVPLLARASFWTSQGRYADADADLKEAFRLEPSNAATLRAIAFNLAASHHQIDSYKAYTIALKKSPKDSRLYFERGVVAVHIPDLEKALADFEQAEKLGFNEPQLFYEKARMLCSYGRNEEALAELEKLDGKQLKENRRLLECRIEILLALGKTKEALPVCEDLIAFKPGISCGYDNKGLVLYRMQRYQEAIEQFNKAIALSPKTPRIYMRRAAAYRKLNRNKEADADMAKVEELNKQRKDL
jgi:tetratricopeptide (TPR) repeat protein